MISKHIYLTEELDRQVHLVALTEKKPEAQVIRERLSAGFALRANTQQGAVIGLVGLAHLATKGAPEDLSRRLDDYLYGDA